MSIPSIIANKILTLCQAHSLIEKDSIQALWSGYGEIYRVYLEQSAYDSVVVKHIKLPLSVDHKRGFNSHFAHQRKLKSYQVEVSWYQGLANTCSDACRIPKCLSVEYQNDEILLILEDLASVGFTLIKESADLADINACLIWLAHFHAQFLNKSDAELWSVGTYWHLATRPDEYCSMAESDLKKQAQSIDNVLNNARFQTLIHGDAKLANFCFSESTGAALPKVAAVDFQYIGRGCGMKDVAYFIGSCLEGESCEPLEEQLLALYFNTLKQALPDMSEFDALEQEWRGLYAFAWADFERFLQGWCPDHWKINDYSQKKTQQALAQLPSNHDKAYKSQ